MKDVIIKVYVESSKPSACSKNNTSQPVFFDQNGRTQAYDRRAQLLARARELKTSFPDHCKPSERAGKPILEKNPKGRWRTWFKQIRFPNPRLFRGTNNCKEWRYEHIDTEEYCCKEDEELGRKKQKKKVETSKLKNDRKGNSHFCDKIRSFLKHLSCISDQCKGT